METERPTVSRYCEKCKTWFEVSYAPFDVITRYMKKHGIEGTAQGLWKTDIDEYGKLHKKTYEEIREHGYCCEICGNGYFPNIYCCLKCEKGVKFEPTEKEIDTKLFIYGGSEIKLECPKCSSKLVDVSKKTSYNAGCMVTTMCFKCGASTIDLDHDGHFCKKCDELIVFGLRR